MNVKTKRSFGTHDGTFHADEVTASALLIVFNLIDRDKIVRTREPAVLEKCEYVCDVGGIYDPSLKLFDHHQADYQGPLSSAGMILNYLKQEGLLTAKEHAMLHHTMIMGVDAHDNGLDPAIAGVATYSHIIANFQPIRHESSREEQEKAFQEALSFAIGHLDRLVKRYRYIQSCRKIVEEAMKQKGPALYFEHPIPWFESFFEFDGEHHPAQFVIMPSGDHWKLRGIPPHINKRMDVRKPLPQAWAGLLGDDLKQVTGIQGAIFCHKGRFISVWETKEDAFQALDLVLKQ